MVVRKERQRKLHKFFTDAKVAKTDFVDVVFVFEDDKVVRKTFNSRKIPSIVEEKSV